jgi:signal transduction histidine kinase
MDPTDQVTILLVDDQPAKLLSYEVILSELGETLVTANSAREALKQLLKNDIAVILIDVCMPDLDGFELAAMIREHPRFQTTAIIFVSAIALTDIDRVKGYEHGAVDYVPVPVVPEVLRAKVRVFAELYRKTRQLERLNAELERRVEERTSQLAQANAELERRVEERTREREMALAQVHEMQKLESLGQLTGGLAHDFNNLLMAILGNLDVLAKRVSDDALGKRLVEGAIKSAERGAALTKRMLSFARRQELKPEAVDVPRLISGMVEMLQRSLGPASQIAMEFEPGLSLVRVDPNQLELALLNLALNSRDAMPEGGCISFSAWRETVSGAVQGMKPGDYVRIAVNDTGAGMDETTLARATEPFFTTKGVGKGTGLGLSMVHGLAAQSGGGMRIASRVGQGTTVELWLPVAEGGEACQQETAAGSPTEAAPRSCVLVVDDDWEVGASTAAMLESLGHVAIFAASGERALELIGSNGKIELVITDHAMPGMTGAELARHIRAAKPDLPIILSTGYADLSSVDDPGITRLAKPYRLSELADILAALIRPESARSIASTATAAR